MRWSGPEPGTADSHTGACRGGYAGNHWDARANPVRDSHRAYNSRRHSNANADFHTGTYGDTHADTITHPDSLTDTDANADSRAHSDAGAHAHFDAYVDAKANLYTHTHTHTHAVADCHAQPNTNP